MDNLKKDFQARQTELQSASDKLRSSKEDAERRISRLSNEKDRESSAAKSLRAELDKVHESGARLHNFYQGRNSPNNY
jgi:chaperonin cofactor prefoldin